MSEPMETEDGSPDDCQALLENLANNMEQVAGIIRDTAKYQRLTKQHAQRENSMAHVMCQQVDKYIEPVIENAVRQIQSMNSTFSTMQTDAKRVHEARHSSSEV